jgi:hypothetical protein
VGPTSNPTSKTIKNTLAGQAVAATLNLALSPGLAPATVQSGVFAGYTAQQLLDAANAALGGAAITKTGLSDLTLNLGYLNASFENRISTGFLACSDQ